MSEQSGRNESSERSGSGRPGADRPGSGRSSSDRPGSERQRRSTPASDMLDDFQRWLLRASARNMGRELSGQVRRTFGGDKPQTSAANVWDTATNEIPPEVGESPECQWCPICRAARRMREAGPGVGGQISGAGDAVASVVQDAISAVDSILSRGGGSVERAAGRSRPASSARSASSPPASARGHADTKPSEPSASDERHDGAGGVDVEGAGDVGVAAVRAGAADPGASHEGATEEGGGSMPADHGPGGWKPGDRLSTEHVIDPDPWADATEADDGMGDTGQPGTDAAASSDGSDEVQLDGQGHEPDDRG